MDTYLDTYLNNLLCLITDEIVLNISYENSRMRTYGRIIILNDSRSLKHLIKLIFIIYLLELFNFVYSI